MKMNLSNTLAFLVFPYLALTSFVVGHAYRYIADPFSWNAKSSEFLEKKNLYPGITSFSLGNSADTAWPCWRPFNTSDAL